MWTSWFQRRPRQFRLATFRFDVTPPPGHSLCGGWIKPALHVDDELEAVGIVLLGAGKPIVLCAVDWTGILNDSHLEWRKALAKAAGTTPDRVALHCVHQHNAPFACRQSQHYVAQLADLPPVVDKQFLKTCLDRGCNAIQRALRNPRECNAIGYGAAEVEGIASNRRVVDGGGKYAWRGSFAQDPQIRDLPVGEIDSQLKTIVFFDRRERMAALHYYAVHPIVACGDGIVTSEFVGLARKLRQEEDPACMQLYFSGCAGDVAAGKFNDRTLRSRWDFTHRLHDAMIRSERSATPELLRSMDWHSKGLPPMRRLGISSVALEQQMANPKLTGVRRQRPAFALAWLDRCWRGTRLPVGVLSLNDARILHLPGEPFVSFQKTAQQAAPGNFVAVAAYGDGGPWYIPSLEAFEQGGYEVELAFGGRQTSQLLLDAVGDLLAPTRGYFRRAG